MSKILRAVLVSGVFMAAFAVTSVTRAESFENDVISAALDETPCSATWCHFGRQYTCTRSASGVASPITPTGNTCEEENGGSNPCQTPGCPVN